VEVVGTVDRACDNGRQCKAGKIIYPHVPIPITVPYSLFELSCAVATGHKHIITKEAKIRREREEAMHHHQEKGLLLYELI